MTGIIPENSLRLAPAPAEVEPVAEVSPLWDAVAGVARNAQATWPDVVRYRCIHWVSISLDVVSK